MFKDEKSSFFLIKIEFYIIIWLPKRGIFGMKNIDSIFEFYLKNRLSIESDEESKKVFASMIALANI